MLFAPVPSCAHDPPLLLIMMSFFILLEHDMLTWVWCCMCHLCCMHSCMDLSSLKLIYHQHFNGHWSCPAEIWLYTFMYINIVSHYLGLLQHSREVWQDFLFFILHKLMPACVLNDFQTFITSLLCLVFECSESFCLSVRSGICWLSRQDEFSVYFLRPFRKCALERRPNKPCGFDFL